MTIRLVAVDLDDTLLRKDWTLSERTVETVRLVQARGVDVTIASGRLPRSAARYAEQLQIECPLICGHGAIVIDLKKDEILYYQGLPRDVALSVVDGIYALNLHCQLYYRGVSWTEKENDLSHYMARLSGLRPSLTDFRSLLETDGSQGMVDKVIAVGSAEAIEEAYRNLGRQFGALAHIATSKSTILEVTALGVDKGRALCFLAAHLGIDRREIMAIGDGRNDLEMIKYAGIGVAMANAHPDLKEAASFVTYSNEEDGVAWALEQFILK